MEKFGRQYAKSIRRDRPKVDDKWHLDEVVISISGKKHWLWRALDQHGNSLKILVPSRRNRRHRKVCSLSNAKEKHLANLVDFASSAPLSRVAEVQWALV